MRKRPGPPAASGDNDKWTRRAVLCGSAVVAALTIRWVERCQGWDRVGEVEIVDPELLDALRFAALPDDQLPGFAHRFLIAAVRFPGEPRLVDAAARLSGLLVRRTGPTVDRDLRRSLDFLARSAAVFALEEVRSEVEARADLPRSQEFFARRRVGR